MGDSNQSLDSAVRALLAQPSCVSDSLVVINDGCFTSVPALIKNTLGRAHCSCSNYIHIIINEFPTAAWSFDLWKCPEVQDGSAWSGSLSALNWVMNLAQIIQTGTDSRKRYNSSLNGGGEAREWFNTQLDGVDDKLCKTCNTQLIFSLYLSHFLYWIQFEHWEKLEGPGNYSVLFLGHFPAACGWVSVWVRCWVRLQGWH